MPDSIELTLVLAEDPKRVFNAWMDPREHADFTGGGLATIEPWTGGRFTAFEGDVHGIFLGVDAPTRIVETFRTPEFPPEARDSRVTVLFEEADGGTRLRIVHTDIPPTLHKKLQKIWDAGYVKTLAKYFIRTPKKGSAKKGDAAAGAKKGDAAAGAKKGDAAAGAKKGDAAAAKKGDAGAKKADAAKKGAAPISAKKAPVVERKPAMAAPKKSGQPAPAPAAKKAAPGAQAKKAPPAAPAKKAAPAPTAVAKKAAPPAPASAKKPAAPPVAKGKPAGKKPVAQAVKKASALAQKALAWAKKTAAKAPAAKATLAKSLKNRGQKRSSRS